MTYLVLGINLRGESASFYFEPETKDYAVLAETVANSFYRKEFYPVSIQLIPTEPGGELLTVGFPDNGAGWSCGSNNLHRILL